MTQMRLVGFEAAALRHADSLSDQDLTSLALGAMVALMADHDVCPQRFRELAMASLVIARRLDTDRVGEVTHAAG